MSEASDKRTDESPSAIEISPNQELSVPPTAPPATDRLIGGAIGCGFVLACICFGLAFLIYYFAVREPMTSEVIEHRIEQFQQSIDNLKAVEKMLATMKSDLMATQRQRDALLAEYKNIEQLKSLNDEQVEAIGYVVGRRSWRQWIVDLLFGIGIGIAGSLLATLLYNWWQRHYKPTPPPRRRKSA